MILRRLGNKKSIAHKIIPYFPPHKIFIEPFFGSGGMFFNKSKAKYNIVNDLDSDVFNLFQVVMNQKEELEKVFHMMPIHSDLLEYWKKNKELDPVKKAIRFLLISNFTYMGKGDFLRFNAVASDKNSFYKNIDTTFDLLHDVRFDNKDFRTFLKNIQFPEFDFGKKSTKKESAFAYLDPLYLETSNNYNCSTWKEKDSFELFESIEKSGYKWAMSEFDHPFILEQVKKRGLNFVIIGERQNLKNRRTEILIMNYENQATLF